MLEIFNTFYTRSMQENNDKNFVKNQFFFSQFSQCFKRDEAKQKNYGVKIFLFVFFLDRINIFYHSHY